jgi:NADP-dependent 3-hydroxy acid dehydrogenase YdfG
MSGERLVATARDPRRLDDLVKKYGDQVRTAPLDVADEKAAFAAVQVAKSLPNDVSVCM